MPEDGASACASVGALPESDELSSVFAQLGLIAGSSAMAPILRQAWKAARVSDAALLIEGETGTGKQVLAQAIHRLDEKRSRHRFVTVHCGSIQDSLAESELFGHRRGAFSGAIDDRKGLFQSAHLGTLFLDDVNDLPLSLQPKLLDVLQRGVVRPVGSDREIPVDVRVISASNQPLEPLVRQRLFRPDLFYRIEVVYVPLPPLRDRSDDLPRLLLAIARRHSDIYASVDSVDPELIEHLKLQTFPGNVRELEHATLRMLFNKTSGSALTLGDWMSQSSSSSSDESADPLSSAGTSLWKVISRDGRSYDDVIAEIEKRILKAALSASGKTRREIAAMLRISERKLYQKIRDYRLGQSNATDEHPTEAPQGDSTSRSMSQTA